VTPAAAATTTAIMCFTAGCHGDTGDVYRRKRGCRGSKHLLPITTWNTNRSWEEFSERPKDKYNSDGVNVNNLVTINSTTPFENKMKLCLLNTRSVKNKAPQIMDYIIEEAFDVMALTETWLRDGALDG
jgi:hypothetical protein